MNTQELAQTIADLMDLSLAEVHDMIQELDVDGVINLTAAAESGDTDVIQDILDEVSLSEPDADQAQTVPEIKAELQRAGRKLLRQDEPLTKLWPLIGKLSASEWKLVWPSLDPEVLKGLYSEATKKQTDTVSASDAQMLHDYSISFIAESMVLYENEWWQVKVPQAPDNLVGISQQDHMIWVPRHDLQSLQEHVLGMTQMPSLARIQELAGIGDQAPLKLPSSFSNPRDLNGADWLVEFRSHIQEIERLQQLPAHADHVEEMQLHMKMLSRKAREAADKLGTTK